MPTVVAITAQAMGAIPRSVPAVTACTVAVQKSTTLSRWIPRHVRRDRCERSSEVTVTATSR